MLRNLGILHLRKRHHKEKGCFLYSNRMLTSICTRVCIRQQQIHTRRIEPPPHYLHHHPKQTK